MSSANNTTPLHDRDAEVWTIGSILLKPSILDDLAWLSRDDFFHDDLRQLYGAAVDMHHRREPIDAAVLGKQFAGDDWAARIAEIAMAVPVAAHAHRYAEIVADLGKRRRLREILLTGGDAVEQRDDAVDDVLERVESELAGVRTAGERGEPMPLSNAAIDAMARIDEIERRGTAWGLATGLLEYDEKIGGLFPGEMTILAARPGVGKTSLALQIADHNAARGRLVYFASLEMSAVELSTRLACGKSGVSNHLLRSGRLNSMGRASLAKAFQEQSTAAIEIHDRAALTAAGIRREIRKRKKRGLVLAVVDYLQLVTPEDRKVVREQQVSRIVRVLKETALEYDVPILCPCQLNRQADSDDTPQLGHLRESGAIEQDADVVLFLSRHQPTKSEPYNTRLSIAKNRNGEMGEVGLYWETSSTRFSCLAQPEFADFP